MRRLDGSHWYGPSARILSASALVAALTALLPAASGRAAAPAVPARPTPAAAPAPAAPPVAARRPVENRYFDTTVSDDYQWLENWSDPETKAWVEGQNAYTRGVLDRLGVRPQVLARITALNRNLTPRYRGLESRGAAIFAMKDQPPKNQPMLVVLGSLDDLSGERVLVDPNALDPSGATTIDFFVPSRDGSRVAVSLSKGGTESGDVHLYEVATGKELPDELPRVNGGTAGGSVAWTADGEGLWYTRYPAPGERPDGETDFWQQAWFHRLGTPRASDTCLMGRELPKIAEIAFETSDDARWLLVAVKNGDGGEIGWWLRGEDGELRAVAGFADHVVDAEFGPDGLYLLSRAADPNGEVARVPFDAPALANATTLVRASVTAIDGLHVVGDRLYTVNVAGGPNELEAFTPEGQSIGSLPVPPLSSVSGFSRLPDGSFAIESESYTEPSRWLRYDPGRGAFRPTALAMRSPANYADIEVRREFATSKDGTRVPVSILMKRGTALDGKAPLLLYGYGGYGISQSPSFSPSRMLWLEQGGVYAVANIRGGREFGDAWHEAGKLTQKQNVFDDFAACAQALVERGYTSAAKLVIQGGSNGGLLMGAELTQHPDLFGAVVSQVGVYDMLRVELSPNGLFNTTEYGSVKDAEQFKALHAYSPYHHVQDGTQYPPTLLLTGVNDPRVAPGNSFKFAARLQASGTKRPVLLRTSMTTGHIGAPLNARNEEYADIYSFIFSQLGITYRPAAAPAP